MTIHPKVLNTLEEISAEATAFEQRLADAKPEKFDWVSPILYRGQARRSWKLETTLERFGRKHMPAEDYRRELTMAKAAIESLLERKFLFEPKNPIDKDGFDYPFSESSPFVKGQYEFMVHLRHHGFPSPLLDWSRSMYVALFFALCDQPDDEASALHMFVEHTGSGKGGCPSGHWISVLPDTVSAHKRHWIQQACYTICTTKNSDLYSDIDDWIFSPHHGLQTPEHGSQDICHVVHIAPEARNRILRQLDSMNINEVSLYGTEDALMKTLARRQMRFTDAD